jgi:hypothetical protein
VIDPADARKVDIALPTIVASTGSWGVCGCHWLPDVDGRPAVWLTVVSEHEREMLEREAWLPSQVTMMLMRQNVPYAVTRHLRVFVDSLEGQRRLLADATDPDETHRG